MVEVATTVATVVPVLIGAVAVDVAALGVGVLVRLGLPGVDVAVAGAGVWLGQAVYRSVSG